MAIPKKKSLLKTAKEKAKEEDKTIKVAAKSIAELQGLYDDGMFIMGEGFTGEEANAGDVAMYYNGLKKAQKYGRLLRRRGIIVPIPKEGD